MEASDYCIYTLADPRDKQIHYVGETRSKKHRLSSHLSETECSELKRIWMEELKQSALKPVMTIIEEGLTREQAFERERYWIRFYLSIGTTLYNYTKPKIRPDEVVNLLKEYYLLLDQGSYQTDQWQQEKMELQIRTQALLAELDANYQIRPFVRYQ